MIDGSTPSPADVRTLDDLAEALQELRVNAGVSYRELHRRVVRARRSRRIPELPAYDTVYRCLQPGRARLDSALVADIVTALGAPDVEAWPQVCRRLARPGLPAAPIVVVSALPPRATFVGRREELESLIRALAGTSDRSIALITGMPGIGKTSLAVEAAWLLGIACRPEVSCFVDLLGYDETRPPVPADAVLEPLLRALGTPPDRIFAADARRRRALLREALDAHRVLLVLDNVRDAGQLAALLPKAGSGSCAIVTSRHRLELGDAALLLDLDVLAPAESAALLVAAGGLAPGAMDDPYVTELAELGGRLPLALSLLAGRMSGRPTWTPADHVDQLRAMRELHRSDPGVEASLWLSYSDLGEADRRLLRLLGGLPVAAVEAHLAAVVGELDLAAARDVLDRLALAHLVRPDGTGRNAVHDAVRTFLAARSVEEDPPRVRRRALEAMYDFQVAATAVAQAYVDPGRIADDVPPGIVVPVFDDRAAATEWLERERADLMTGAFSAIEHGRIERAVTLSALLFGFLIRSSYLGDAQRLYVRLADVTTGTDRAGALLALGAAYGSAGQPARARAALDRALAEYQSLGDPTGVAKVRHNLGALCWEVGDYPGAIDHYRRALEARAEGPAGTAMTLDNLGTVYARVGRHDEARTFHELALELHRQLGDRLAEGRTLGNLGALGLAAGRRVDGRRLLTSSSEIGREVGDRIGELLAAGRLAELDSLEGRHDEAVDGLRRAATTARSSAPTSEEARGLLLGLATAYRRAGLPADAARAQSEALMAAQTAGDPYWTARALAEGAELAGAAGNRAAADRLDAEATALFERLGCPERNRPERSRPERSRPEQSQPEQSQPERCRPEQNRPEQSRPERPGQQNR